MGLEELLLDRAKNEGLFQGREQGREQGRHEEALEIARSLKKEGLAVDFIAKTTKLSIKEIQAL